MKPEASDLTNADTSPLLTYARVASKLPEEKKHLAADIAYLVDPYLNSRRTKKDYHISLAEACRLIKSE